MFIMESVNVSKFQRRHYQSLAAVLVYSHASETVVSQMISMLQNDNANFSEDIFRGYMAGLKSPVI
jgi:hypothetical protein